MTPAYPQPRPHLHPITENKMASVSRAKVSYIFRIRLANVLVSPSEFQVFLLLLVDLGIHLYRE